MEYLEIINYISTLLELEESKTEHDIYKENKYYIDYDVNTMLFNYKNIEWAIEYLNYEETIKYNNNSFILYNQHDIFKTYYFKNHIEVVNYILEC